MYKCGISGKRNRQHETHLIVLPVQKIKLVGKGSCTGDIQENYTVTMINQWEADLPIECL